MFPSLIYQGVGNIGKRLETYKKCFLYLDIIDFRKRGNINIYIRLKKKKKIVVSLALIYQGLNYYHTIYSNIN